MPGRRRIWLLVLLMAVVAVGVAAVSLTTLYRTSLRLEQARLVDIARSQARFLEAVARFDMVQSVDHPGGAFQATLSQFREASRHFGGMGETGEMILARRDGDWIQILFRHRVEPEVAPDSVPMGGRLGEAQSRALSGESGVMVGLDSRGRRVLAAFEPVGVYDLGIVAKMDLREVRAPFLRAGMLAAGVGLLLILLGSVLFLRVSEPLLQQLRESEARYRLMVENTVDGVWDLDSDFRFTYVNPAVEPLLGYTREEWVGSCLADHCSGDDFGKAREAAVAMAGDPEAGESGIRMDMELFRKDGKPVQVEITARPLVLPDGSLQFQGATRDVSERVAREEALRVKAEELEALFSASPAAIVQLDPGGKVRRWNPAAERIFGWGEEEVLGEFLPLVPPEKMEEFADLRSRVLAGESLSGVELTRRRKDGTTVEVRLSTAPLRDREGAVTGIMAVLEDITEEKRAARALEESESFVRAVMDALPVGVAVNSVEPSVDFRYMNDNFPRLYRSTREALADPDSFWETAYQDPGFREEIRNRVFEDLASEDPERWSWEDLPITRTGEETTFISARNAPVPGRGLMISTVWDVTKRKRAEEALRASEDRYRSLFEKSHAIMFVLDSKTGRFMDVNPSALRFYGYSREALLSLSIYDINLLPKEEVEEVLRDASNRKRKQFVSPHRLADGTQRMVEVYAGPVQMEEGGQVLSIIHDITDRVEAEKEICRLNADLEQRIDERTAQLSAANQELEAFTHTVSHDLKAPLRAIDGFSRILEKEYGPGLDDEGRRVLGVIRANAGRMAQLIDDLLAFSRLGRTELRRTRVDLGSAVASVLEDIRPDVEARRVELAVEELPTVWGDRMLLRQVFLNLLSNALKFTSTREVARIAIGWRDQEEGMDIFVQDNGVGFDPDYGHKLFSVFQRLHHEDEFPGTGVGLANVRRIVERHGGRVWAEGRLGAGATFHFTIPGEPPEAA